MYCNRAGGPSGGPVNRRASGREERREDAETDERLDGLTDGRSDRQVKSRALPCPSLSHFYSHLADLCQSYSRTPLEKSESLKVPDIASSALPSLFLSPSLSWLTLALSPLPLPLPLSLSFKFLTWCALAWFLINPRPKCIECIHNHFNVRFFQD